VTYEEALQIAIEELDEKIQCLSDTFNGHSARIESYIYDLSMARKALMQELKDADAKSAVIDAVERAVRKGYAPSNIEKAYEEYMRN
jgi:hypothetical protein